MDENKDKACRHHSPGIYQPRHPENTALYQILQEDLETWITQTQENGGFVSPHVEKGFRACLKCGLLCYGLPEHGVSVEMSFWLRFPVKGLEFVLPVMLAIWWKLLPTWLTMFFPPKVGALGEAPVRQWVLSLPKRLRYFLYHNPHTSDTPVKIGGICFIHRFGSTLNAHPHFHCIIIERVFVQDSDSQIIFHKISSITEKDIQAVQRRVRLRVLKSFKRNGLLESHDVENMKTWNGGGGIFLYKELVNGSARIHENDREGLERLIRYCARPPFALERIKKNNLMGASFIN